MKTVLPESITTVEEAKAFLHSLHSNGEDYHPEDDAHDIIWSMWLDEPPTPDECDKLNLLMGQVYEFFDEQTFDPCGYLLDLEGHIIE